MNGGCNNSRIGQNGIDLESKKKNINFFKMDKVVSVLHAAASHKLSRKQTDEEKSKDVNIDELFNDSSMFMNESEVGTGFDGKDNPMDLLEEEPRSVINISDENKVEDEHSEHGRKQKMSCVTKPKHKSITS